MQPSWQCARPDFKNSAILFILQVLRDLVLRLLDGHEIAFNLGKSILNFSFLKVTLQLSASMEVGIEELPKRRTTLNV
jgi:hypothetical protein